MKQILYWTNNIHTAGGSIHHCTTVFHSYCTSVNQPLANKAQFIAQLGLDPAFQDIAIHIVGCFRNKPTLKMQILIGNTP